MEVIKENQEYLITLVVDKDYLENKNTVYPVTVDPSFSYSTSSGFEDATIYTNHPSNDGNSSNMFVGNYSGRYNSTRGIARVLVRFPGLFSNSQFNSIQWFRLNSVKYMLRDTMCEGDSSTISAYMVSEPWNENTVIYNTSIWGSAENIFLDSKNIHYQGGTDSSGTGTGNWYSFDITWEAS